MIAELETEDLLACTLVWPAEINEGVQLEVQVLHLDSTLEVDDFCSVFDVSPEIGGDQSLLPDKHKKTCIMTLGDNSSTRNPTCCWVPGTGVSFKGKWAATKWDKELGAPACVTSSII